MTDDERFTSPKVFAPAAALEQGPAGLNYLLTLADGLAQRWPWTEVADAPVGE